VPLSAPFIAAYGWRALCLLFAGLVLLALPFILRVLRDPPLAAPIPRGTAPAGAGRDLTTRQALATATFWVMGLACLLGQSGSSAVQMHAIPFLMDRGLTRATASNIWGTLALAAIAGRIGLGWLADRYEARVTMFIAVCLQAGSVVIALAFPGVMAAWAFALLFGLGMGAQNGSRPLLPAEYFGTRAYGTIWGLVTLFTLPGSAGGQPLAGFLYDLTGNYRTPYLVFVATWMVGLLALVLLGRPPERQVTAARR
jgi:predicted MFS family arabinose efflux permease